MPSVPDEFVPFRALTAAPTAPAQQSPGLAETIGAAGVINNWPYRSWRHLQNRDGIEDDPNHDPFEMLKGTKYEVDPQRFAFSRSEAETTAIMREWDADEEAMQTLGRAGWGGVVAGVGMGVLDPTVFIPIAQVFSGVGRGVNAARLAGDVALTSAATAAVGEAAMAATTPNYTAGDVALNIGTATLLGGLIGGGAGALLSRSERAGIEAALNADRQEWTADIAPPARPASAPAAQAQAAGAAAADTRQLKLRSSVAGLNVIPDITAKVSPPRRVLNAGFASARRTVVDLVETPYIFEENVQGVATTQGPALDRLARMEIDKARMGMHRVFDDAFSRYRFGTGQAETLQQRVRNTMVQAADLTGRPRTKASRAEFNAMVDEALRNNDTHSVPEVAEVAQHIRANVLDPWKDRAIAAGLLPEGVDVGTAASYMMRSWNKERLIADRPRAAAIFADWLEAEEAKKAAIQETLTDLEARYRGLNEELSKLEARATPPAEQISEIIAEQGRLRQLIEEQVKRWEGKSTREAQSALKTRAADETARTEAQDAGTYSGRGERLTGADAAVEAAVRRIVQNSRIRDRAEIDGLAQEIIDRIVGAPDGRLPYDAPSASNPGAASDDLRGPLAAREFMIPDEMVRDFIDTDAHNTAELYLSTIVPDVLLTERFGDIRMTEAFRKLNDEAAAQQMVAKTEKERRAIAARQAAVNADLAAMRDRIRGVYGFSSDPRMRFVGRVAQSAARYDVMTNLGGAAISSLADMAGTQWRYGFAGAFRHAWRPFFKALYSKETRKAIGQYRDEFRALAIAAETHLNTRASSLHDITDVYRPTSRLERGLKFGSDKFGLVSLLTPWTDFGKLGAGMVSSSQMILAAEAVVKGNASRRQIRDLAENGIDAAMAQRIVAQFNQPGAVDVVDGLRIPNTGAWTDIGARDAFQGAVTRDVNMMVITPGAEKPLMFSQPVAALILQYKSFIAAANERILVRSLQARDAQVLQGLVSAIGLGILAEAIYSQIVGRDLPKNPADLIKAGLTRSGALGWYQEANAISEKWTGGAADAFRLIGAERPDSRYISRSQLGALLGPTANKLEAFISSGYNVANLNWTAGDTRRVRRLLAGQNLFYIRGLLDKIETQVNEAAGVEPFAN